MELPANGSAQITINTGLPSTGGTAIYSLAVDGSGDILVSAEVGVNSVEQRPIFEIYDVYGNAIPGFSIPQAGPGNAGQLAADSQGNFYFANFNQNTGYGIVELLRTLPANFGNVNVCATGQTQPAPCGETATLVYQVTAAGTFGGATVATNGSTSDFQQTGTSTCYGQLSVGQTCGVGVTFSPSIPNAQSGTVQIVDGSSNVISTTALKGFGVGSTPLLSGQPSGSLRNNYSGFVGFQFTVGTAPVEIFSLGRFVVSGNTGTHLVKLVQANGVDVPGGSATVYTGAASSGAYSYASLASPITLAAGTSYYLVSQETAGGDQWYDLGPVTSTSEATVVGPTYTDFYGHYVTVGGLAGNSYVPVNFQYASAPATTVSVSITSPVSGATLSGVAAVTVSTTGPVTSLQIQLNGTNVGSAFAPNAALSFDTTLQSNGPYSLSVVASDAQSHTVTSSPVSISIFNQSGGVSPFVTSQGSGNLRNNYSGFVGFSMAIGNSPVVVSQLGRYVALGNTGKHVLKLVNSNGTDVPGGSTLVSLDPGEVAPGTFNYAPLASPVTLQPNTTYLLVSQETAGGDQWYDLAPVATTSVAAVTAPVYTDGGGHYIQVSSYPGESYVPVNFLYEAAATPLSVSIISPQAGAALTAASVPVVVNTTGSVSSLQLQVDGVSQGTPVTSGQLTFNTTTVSSGQHTLTVVANGFGGTSVVSPGVIVTVVAPTSAPFTIFITGETPSTLRNNYSGFVGMQIQVGATPLTVTALGRSFAGTSSSAHTVKLVEANGTDVPGGSVSVSAMGATGGQFVYGALASPVTLAANTAYYLVSQETAGGDQWYDLEPVTGTGVAQILGATYVDGHGTYVTVPGAGYSYVPVSFQYH